MHANQRIGAMVCRLLSERHQRAGKEHPFIVVGSINELLNTLTRAIRKEMRQHIRLTPAEFEAYYNENPVCRYYYHIYSPMVWASLLSPTAYGEIVQVVPTIERYLRVEAGCEPLTKAEVTELTKQLLGVMAAPPSDELGSSGYAIYQAATEKLDTLPVLLSDSRARGRRRRYLRRTFELCFAVEDTDLAARKHAGSLIAEMLRPELRHSGCRDTAAALDLYWQKFDLFFHASRLVP